MSSSNNAIDRPRFTETDDLAIKNLTKTATPDIPYIQIKHQVLGLDYFLSLVFIGDKRARYLNRTYRQQNYTPSILSFPLSDSEGEMFIDLCRSKKKAEKQDSDLDRYTAFLFIHGLLHLKGLQHGSTMERREQELWQEFGW